MSHKTGFVFSVGLYLTLLFCDVAVGQRGLYPTLNLTNHQNNTGLGLGGVRIGICTLEVPTIDLINPQDRHGPLPRGNGTREGYSKIEICCSGYERKPHNAYECQPICENGCENGNCTAPNVCTCKRGYIKNQEQLCIPTCPIGCLNGVCTFRGTCDCNNGYSLSPDGKYCIPICANGCGEGGKCTGPETCTCAKGFSVNRDTGRCEYHCEGGCGQGGRCIGPNKCSCQPGFIINRSGAGPGCVPDCPKGCKNGICSAPNTCTCQAGYSLDKETGSICTPHCSRPCLNADCSAPEVCTCKRGYIEAPGSDAHKCVAHCPTGCPNGVCSAPNFCICNPGYVKEVKGSNVCIRRVRRSIMHFELIPEEVIAGF